MAGSSQGTVGNTDSPDVSFYEAGGGENPYAFAPNVDYTTVHFESQPIVPRELPATASMEMGDRSLEWGADSALAAEYPVLYDIGVPPRPETTLRDPKFDPLYYQNAQTAQIPPIVVDIPGSLPLPFGAQPLGVGGIASPGEGDMYASLLGIVQTS